MGFTQIGTEGGYLKSAVPLTELTIAPGERADILVDFSNVAGRHQGDPDEHGEGALPRRGPRGPADGRPDRAVHGHRHGRTGSSRKLPAVLNPTLAGATFPNLPAPVKTRYLTLEEVMGPAGRSQILLDGQSFMTPPSRSSRRRARPRTG